MMPIPGGLSRHLESFDDLVVRIAQGIVVYDPFFKKVGQIDTFNRLVERLRNPSK
jgi:hypothetical protein